MYLSVVDSELKNAPEQNTAPSLTTDERQVLRYPKRNTEAAIRESVKVSAVTIMSRKRYIAEAYRLLRDTDVYQQVSNDWRRQVSYSIEWRHRGGHGYIMLFL